MSLLQGWEAGNRLDYCLEGARAALVLISMTSEKTPVKGLTFLLCHLSCNVPLLGAIPFDRPHALAQSSCPCSGLPLLLATAEGMNKSVSGSTAGTANSLGECPEFVGSPWLGRNKAEGETISQGCNYSQEVLK